MKHVPLYIVSHSQINDNLVTLVGDDSRHLTRVLRRVKGEQVCCRESSGITYDCSIEEIDKEHVLLKIISSRKLGIYHQNIIGCYMALPRPNTFSELLPPLCELGLDFIQPMFTKYSFIKHTDSFNMDRYKRIVVEAMKQCKRERHFEIKAPISFSQIDVTLQEDIQNIGCKTNIPTALIFPYEREQNVFLKGENYSGKNKIFVIGPEGGFADEEGERLIQLGFQSVSLASAVLRVPTAAIAALSRLLE